MADQFPLPSGATAVSSSQPFPLPPGATPVSATAAPGSGIPPVDPASLSHATDLGTGILKGAGDTVSGVSHLIHKIPVIGETLAPQAGIDALDKLDTSQNTTQSVGKGLEAAGEWMIPGLAEDTGATRAAKLVSLAKKYPILADTLNLATHHPWLAKIITEGAEGAATGGTIGAVKGAQQGQTAKGAATGAAVGGATGAAVAAAPMLMNPFRKATSTISDYASDIWKGAGKAQEPAQAAVREGAQAVLPTAQPQELRTVLEHPIDTLESQASQNYKEMDVATDGKFQPNVDALKNVNKELRNIAGTAPEREAELEATRQRLEWQQDQLLNTAEVNGVPKETVQLAKNQFRQAQALHDLDTKVFKNFSVIDLDGNVKVDAALKALTKLQDNTTWGAPRLEQAIGKDAAATLINSLKAARQQGLTAVSRQQLAKSFAKYVGVPAAGVAAATAGTYLYHAILGDS